MLAFAHPYIEQKLILPRKRSGEVTVLAIDNSLSMRAGDRLAQAKQAAKSLVARTARRASAPQVLAFGSRVQVDERSHRRPRAPERRASMPSKPSDARTSFAELTRTLRSIAQSLHLPLDVHLYSDMQQTGMPANFNDLRLNADVRLEPHADRQEREPNFTVENVVAPRRVYDTKKARVLATVAGYGTPEVHRATCR